MPNVYVICCKSICIKLKYSPVIQQAFKSRRLQKLENTMPLKKNSSQTAGINATEIKSKNKLVSLFSYNIAETLF